MKNKHIVIIIILLIVVMAGIGASALLSQDEEPALPTAQPTASPIPTPEPTPVILRLAHCLESNGSLDIAADRWAERVNDMTGGLLTIEIYPEAKLFDKQTARNALMSGELDICIADIDDFTDIVPACELYSLPFLFTGYADAKDIVYGEVGRQIDTELEIRCGVKPLGWAWNGFRVLYMPGYANTVYTCGGIKIRCGGDEMSIDTFRLLGMGPQVISWSKTYAAIEDGTVDGTEAELQNLYDENYVRLGKALVYSKHRLSVAGPVFNADVWNALDDDTKEIIETAWLECRDELNNTVSVSEDALAAKLVELGCPAVQFGSRDDNVRVFEPYWSERAENGSYAELLQAVLQKLGIE